MLNVTKVIIFTCTISIDIYSSFGNFETVFCFFTNNMDTCFATAKTKLHKIQSIPSKHFYKRISRPTKSPASHVFLPQSVFFFPAISCLHFEKAMISPTFFIKVNSLKSTKLSDFSIFHTQQPIYFYLLQILIIKENTYQQFMLQNVSHHLLKAQQQRSFRSQIWSLALQLQ